MEKPNPRTPPHSLEAERSVLGALMLDNRSWDRVADVLQEPDFYRPENRLIFQAIFILAKESKPFDVLTIAEVLKKQSQLERIGGEVYLFELANNTPSAANILAYAEIVRDRAILRRLAEAGTDIIESVSEAKGRETKELLEQAERQIFQISAQHTRGVGPQKISTLAANIYHRLDDLRENGGSEFTGLRTQYTDFDKLTFGLQKSDLIIIAGRPSMGKTTFAMNIAEYSACAGKAVLVFSMEMPAEQLLTRMFASLSQVDQTKLKTGKNLTSDEWSRITHAVTALGEAPMFIDDTPALSPTEIRSRIRRIARENGGLDLIVVDYLQLMQIPGHREGRVTEISEISRTLKAIAKEMGIPVIALSQLNRSLEHRTDRRPVMSDLRESGSIEQDADLIAFIYRDEVYNENSDAKGTAEILIRKHRNGPIGEFILTFQGKYNRFVNHTSDVSSGAYA